MRRLGILFIGFLFFIVGCNVDNEAKDSALETGAAVDEPVEEEEEMVEVEAKQKVEAEESVSDVEDVLHKMKEAIRTVKTVSGTGTTDSEGKIAGTTSKSTVEMELETMIEPFTSHITHTVIDGEDDDGEMYVTADNMYVYTDETGWLKVFLPELLQVATKLILTESHIDQYLLYKDLFELTEEGNHFILTYVGSDEQYKEVFYDDSIHASFTGLAGAIADMLKEMELSGTVELKVSKDTFLTDEHHSVHESSFTMHGMTMESIDDGTYIFTYNDIDSVTIPADIVDNAQEMNLDF